MIILEMCKIKCRTWQQVEALLNEIEISTHIKYVQDNKVAGDAGRTMLKSFLNDGKLCSL